MSPVRPFLAAVLICCAIEAQAGCGSAFCSLNTDWNAQGVWTEPGGRFDLRYEFIDQDQPRTGTQDLSVGEIPQHHDEVRTINRNWIASFEYTFNSAWGIGVQLPLVDRSHSHIHNHHGAQLVESWNFTEIGDARVMGRYRFVPGSSESGAFGLQLGLKLPTGDYNVENDDGDLAERSLQPGTGTLDAIVGAFYSGRWGATATWFADANLISAITERDGYEPGDRVGLNVGITWPLTGRVAMLLQLNTLWKDRDAGDEAEPDHTGGTFVHLSPGVSLELGDRMQLYSYVQLPLYQAVNGVQLVAEWAFTAGLGYRF
jgi:hypothetical protein